MGRTATCAVEIATAKPRSIASHADVPVLLETDEIILRLTPRKLVPRAAITTPHADAEALVFTHAGALYTLRLGAKEAAKWAHELLHPKTRMDKLGVAVGASIATVGVDEAYAPGFLAELAAHVGHAPADALGADRAVVFLAAKSRASLASLANVVESLAKGGALWILRPKGKAAPADAPTEAEVRAACRALDLVDVKVARFSDALTAEKYVRRAKP